MSSGAAGVNVSFEAVKQITGTGKVVFNGGSGDDDFTGTEAAVPSTEAWQRYAEGR